MELNHIINDDDISTKMQEIYKFIDKNDDKITDIFNATYNDIKNIYPNTTIDNNYIEIHDIDPQTIMSHSNECHSILSHHAKEILQDNSYLIPYAFKMTMLKDTITIIKRH